MVGDGARCDDARASGDAREPESRPSVGLWGGRRGRSGGWQQSLGVFCRDNDLEVVVSLVPRRDLGGVGSKGKSGLKLVGRWDKTLAAKSRWSFGVRGSRFEVRGRDETRAKMGNNDEMRFDRQFNRQTLAELARRIGSTGACTLVLGGGGAGVVRAGRRGGWRAPRDRWICMGWGTKSNEVVVGSVQLAVGKAPRPKVRGGGGTVRLPPRSRVHPVHLILISTFSLRLRCLLTTKWTISPFLFSRPLHSRTRTRILYRCLREPGARIGPVAIRPSGSLYGVSGGSPVVTTTNLQTCKLTRPQAPGCAMGLPVPETSHHIDEDVPSHPFPRPTLPSRVKSLEAADGTDTGFRLRRQCEGARVQTETWAAVSPSGPHFFFFGVFGSHAAAAAHG